ncbi:MAG: DUF5667 domain-containing protein [Candidatus Pacebacteria bacterium]|nr:DUF5667 domain-containing protein [Candidatus Paceibacterota bacterium]
MNKKIIFALILSISFTFLGGSANAATQNNILPSSPFYFFKDLGRQIQDFLTINPTQKVELRLKVAEEKLSEIEQIAEENPNNPNYEAYLNKYKEAVLKIQEETPKLAEERKEQILENITSTMLEQEQRLEDLKNNIRTDKSEVVEQIKNNIISEYTETSLRIADNETVQNKIEEKIQNLGEEKAIEVYNRIRTNTSDTLSNILDKTDLAKIAQERNLTIQNEDLIRRMNEGASSLGLSPEEILEKVSTFSAEDKERLEKYALEVIAGNVKLDEAINGIELSEDAISKIKELQNRTTNCNLITHYKKQCSYDSLSKEDKKILAKINAYCLSALITPEEFFDRIIELKEEERMVLKKNALDILTTEDSLRWNKVKNLISDFSESSKEKIGILMEYGSIRTGGNDYASLCVIDGYKVTTRFSNNFNVEFCVSPDGKECLLKDYFNEKCSFKDDSYKIISEKFLNSFSEATKLTKEEITALKNSLPKEDLQKIKLYYYYLLEKESVQQMFDFLQSIELSDNAINILKTYKDKAQSR